MKTLSEKRLARRRLERPKTSVTIRLPEDVVEDLREMAPVLGWSSAESLIRVYISEGMRRDESRLNQPEIVGLLESLRRHGVDEKVIAEVVSETLAHRAPEGAVREDEATLTAM